MLESLAARLDGASIKRSVVEDVLRSAGCAASVRRQVDRLLVEADISVLEDIVVPVEPGPIARSDDEHSPVLAVDPIDAARRRLKLDRSRPPRRLAKILLKPEEEVGLTLLARPDSEPLEPGGFAELSGEAKEAADAMLLHNMGLIHSVAQRLGGQGLEYDDLVASGIPGLVRAIEKFDPYRGLKFSTYAMHWVRQSIGRAIDDEGRLVRLPVYVCASIRALKSAQERLTVDGRPPSWAALAKECRITLEKVEELLRLAPAVVSLDSPVGNDGVTLGDLLDRPIAHHEPVEVRGFDADDLEVLLGDLVPREEDVLRRRHGLRPYDDKATLDEIGQVYGVTRERVRQIESKAITNIRVHLGLESPKVRRKRQWESAALAESA
ncbi:RNA polymerase sigma factor RpoD/SigA [uncultured Nocardioides sp.]|uniref:sigma-70 family RNA polymerase sigma factor n=1 Tax=uncultured Nocardioides sp. TaxID=198441 RepID=UPI002628B1C6|nr:RNA polymerase sigma factor RpoD/SigA [uncultured Nocardioides sp.]